MSNRYFLSTLLPALSLTRSYQMSIADLEFALKQNLSPYELQVVNQVWLLGDVENIRAYLHDESMNSKGSLPPEKIAGMLAWDEKKPIWLERFLSDFPSDEERIHKSALLSHYCLLYGHKDALHESIQELLTLEFETRSVFQLLRGGKKEPEGASFLHERETEWPPHYQTLVRLWEQHKNDPLALEQHVAEWRFMILEEKRVSHSPFSLSFLIFSVALFAFIESRRPLIEKKSYSSQERIVKALKA